MSKMNELSQALDELVSCGEGLIRAANAIRVFLSSDEPCETKKAPPAEAAKATPVEEPEKTYSYMDVRKACSAKSSAKHTDEVKALISKYGADKLSGVKESDYPAFMRDLEAIG